MAYWAFYRESLVRSNINRAIQAEMSAQRASMQRTCNQQKSVVEGEVIYTYDCYDVRSGRFAGVLAN